MSSSDSGLALEADCLVKQFGGLRAVGGVSLDVHVGEVHAVIGPNGAGKSTLINLLSGDLHVTSGTIRVGGRDITALSPQKRALAGLGRSYQKTTIFQSSTVFENARLAAQAHSGHALRMVGAAANDTSINAKAEAALNQVRLGHRAGVKACLLSHGEQRQLEIAMVLATDPKIVLLDEPLAGMGQAEAVGLIGLIRSMKTGCAVLLVEHDMDAVFALADRLTVMADGLVIGSGRPDEVRASPAVRKAYLGAHGDETGEAA